MSRITYTRLFTRTVSYRAAAVSRSPGNNLLATHSCRLRNPSQPPCLRLYSTSSKGAPDGSNEYVKVAIVVASAISLAVTLGICRSVCSDSSSRVESGSSTLQTNYASPKELQLAIRELQKAFPDSHVVETDPETLRLYGSSENSYHPTSPHSVVIRIHSTEDVVKVVNISRKYRVPLTAYSGATSLEGQFSGVCGFHTPLSVKEANVQHLFLSTHQEVSVWTCLAWIKSSKLMASSFELAPTIYSSSLLNRGGWGLDLPVRCTLGAD